MSNPLNEKGAHLDAQRLAEFMAQMSQAKLEDEIEATWGKAPKSVTSDTLTLKKLEQNYRYFKAQLKGPLSENDKLNLIRARNQMNETVWHEGAAKELRDLGVNSGIALSVIARAAQGDPYYKIRVPDRYIEEYRKWRNVYDVTKHILKGK